MRANSRCVRGNRRRRSGCKGTSSRGWIALIDRLTHETRFVIRIARRDLAKRVVVFALIAAVCVLGHASAGMPALVLLILGSEVASLIIWRAVQRRGTVLTPRLSVTMWAINVGSTALYLWPSLLLSGAGSVPLLLSGFLWLFGTFVHVTNTFIALPLYNRTQMVPATAMALAAFWIASGTRFGPGTPAEWLVSAALVGVYVANTFETILAQKDTQAALDAARADATARLRALERLSRQDGLTGLLNRRAFEDSLGQWLSRPSGRERVAVFMIDLDGFNPINDTFSHAAGDAVLVAVARRLATLAPAPGLAARIGGDEFVIATAAPASPAAALDFARRLLAAIDRPIPWADRTLRLTGSIGIALSGPGLDDAAALCGGADRAMLRAKSGTGARAALHNPVLDRPPAGLADRAILRDALRRLQIVPFYQVKVRLDTGTPIGVEALARWTHP